jgi:NTE family protein
MVSQLTSQTQNRIGIALGSGSARGLAHIGVIRELHSLGIEPTIVCGTSIGALVGAVYVSGHLDTFDSWVRTLNTKDIIRYMDIKLLVGGGFAHGKQLIDLLKDRFGDLLIEDLPKPFAAVATELNTGREIWVREGSLWEAVRASISFPGILTPVKVQNRWLVDGGLVNPVPVSVCRAMGSEAIIAVNLNGDIVGRRSIKDGEDGPKEEKTSTEIRLLDKLAASIKERATPVVSQFLKSSVDSPGLFEVIAGSIDIMQDRITRSRLAGEPADLVLAPRLGRIKLLEFDRAEEIIEEGRDCVRRMLPAIQDAISLGIH